MTLKIRLLRLFRWLTPVARYLDARDADNAASVARSAALLSALREADAMIGYTLTDLADRWPTLAGTEAGAHSLRVVSLPSLEGRDRMRVFIRAPTGPRIPRSPRP